MMNRQQWHDLPSKTRQELEAEFIKYLPAGARSIEPMTPPPSENSEEAQLQRLADLADLEASAQAQHKFVSGLAYKGVAVTAIGFLVIAAAVLVPGLLGLLAVGAPVVLIGLIATILLIGNHDPVKTHREWRQAKTNFTRTYRHGQ